MTLEGFLRVRLVGIPPEVELTRDEGVGGDFLVFPVHPF